MYIYIYIYYIYIYIYILLYISTHFSLLSVNYGVSNDSVSEGRELNRNGQVFWFNALAANFDNGRFSISVG